MKKTFLATALILALAITSTTNAQVGIGVSTANINPSAQLDVSSTTKGFLPPRMTTTQRDAISTPATGLVIFNTTTNSIEYRSSTGWVELTAVTPTTMGTVSGNSTASGGTITSGVLSLAPADGNNGGIVTTAAQTFAGPKTFNADLIAHGVTVGTGSGDIISNTAVGQNSLYNNTSGYYNTANGFEALYLNNIGVRNTANGFEALHSNINRSENTANGVYALFFNTSGYANTANGVEALNYNTIGNYNTANGKGALYNNTTGSTNTANGYYSLYNNTTGYQNTAVGASSLASSTTANQNTAIGFGALASTTTGSNNTALGYYANVASNNLTNATAIGANAVVTNNNTIQLGDISVTNVVTSGQYTGSGFKTPTGTNTQYLMADGSTSAGQTATISAMQAQIATMQTQIAALLSQVNGLLSTVTIGAQLWTKHNLNVSTYRNGDSIPQVTDPTVWASLTTGAWCYYNNDSANDAIYGKLYNWYAVNDPRGLAPVGYHISTDAEWSTSIDYLGQNPGGKMKESGTTHWENPNTGANNSSGFLGLPGGFRSADGAFVDLGRGELWWSSTEDDSANASWTRNVNNYSGDIGRYAFNKIFGFSVRCIKD